ncbi:SDR family NAD(P)-dependent oxidoreductase [Synoicihabitans lomoniglobus]|uniref:SDR family NAD(P)-dependent oxidoreductase n=1 Tax=Synoicihabitans lomoniglobus TaxID=2909285 RepID=A0AAF0CIN2_9BACT|nr:SDR family oxidoreductase [Opitutaceae bacterium LMO-M01]WED65597.1 SDR family NAD(P)-dependent oxidoreductase [Opitutaceae bacterium LMO-M01]
MDLALSGKRALITGGSVGIGLAVAHALAAEGVHIAICARNGDRAQAAADAIAQTHGVETLALPADVAQAADINHLVTALTSAWDGIDILINNAGTGSEEKILTAPDDKWQYYWDLHVMAAVRLSRALAPTMKTRGGGAIINNASICATQPLYYEPIYNTTKSALVMFSKCLANELIPDDIRVNTINPGLVLTPDWRKTAGILTEGTDRTADDYLNQIAEDNTPIKRFASPEEVANFFVFLCSPKASYCVGSTYYVDGGWLKVTQ